MACALAWLDICVERIPHSRGIAVHIEHLIMIGFTEPE